MEVESNETIQAAIKATKEATQAVLDDAFVKIETVIRDSVAVLAGALNGWELTISEIKVTPIIIKLKRSV